MSAVGRADTTQTTEAAPADRPSIAVAGILLGIGFGGFFDGILLHQILQWHHMLTSTGDHPATTVAGLEDNTLADGLFHALTFVAALTGLAVLWKAVGRGAVLAGRHLLGLMLAAGARSTSSRASSTTRSSPCTTSIRTTSCSGTPSSWCSGPVSSRAGSPSPEAAPGPRRAQVADAHSARSCASSPGTSPAG